MVKFAQLGQTGVYAPIHATVGTKIGTFTIRARRFEAISKARFADHARHFSGCRRTPAHAGAIVRPRRMARATLIGFSAVAMWALLALLTDASGAVPPFLLSAITFAIGTCVGLAARLFIAAADTAQKIPRQVWLIGIAGLFGYHFFYFTALRNAPAVEASLIAYLWPLLIVLGSALMPGERLRWNHVAGALLGLAGTVLIVTKGGGACLRCRYAFGYAMAGVCAFCGRPIRCCRGASRRCRPASSPGSAPRPRRFRWSAISRWKRPCCRAAPANGWPCSASA